MIVPPRAAFDSTATPPGSKSITNRALVVAALARGTSEVRGVLDSDDTSFMVAALRSLKIAVVPAEQPHTLVVRGCDGRLPPGEAALFVGNAGTAARFLAPALTLGTGPYVLDGNERMRQRPIAPLASALRELGASVESLGAPDSLPLRIAGPPGGHASAVTVSGNLSSQYLSGLLLSGRCFASGLRVEVTGVLVSEPYLDLTCDVMRSFGADVERRGPTWHVPPGGYSACTYAVEPDASAASYFLAAAAITGSRVVIDGLGRLSRQGDLEFARVLGRMGCSVDIGAARTELVGPAAGRLSGIEVDMRDISDTAQTLAAVAPFASGPTRVTGIGFIRRKETDRIGAVVAELRRLGIEAAEEPDGFLIHPGQPSAGRVSTHDDHRMAMSFALLGLRASGIVIDDPACVSKTYPGYFDDLVAVTGCAISAA